VNIDEAAIDFFRPRANLPKVCEGQTDVLFAVDQMLSTIQEVKKNESEGSNHCDQIGYSRRWDSR